MLKGTTHSLFFINKLISTSTDLLNAATKFISRGFGKSYILFWNAVTTSTIHNISSSNPENADLILNS